MANRIFQMLTVSALALICLQAGAAPNCPPQSGVALQVLGSGGPIADDARASAGYVVWVDGESRFLIDAGGGTFLRFAESGADFDELDFIGLSHFHTDHSADLPALLKSASFSDRTRDIAISGPDAGGPFPGLGSFLDSMLGTNGGAYAYLSGYLDGSNASPILVQTEVDASGDTTVSILGDADSADQVLARGVPHGIVPAIAYRVRVGDSSVVFASDQNGNDDSFIDFAKDATVLVMHMPVPESVAGAGRALHAPPSVIGGIASDAGVSKLVLSHFMARSLREIDKNVGIVRSEFSGPVVAAEDLACVVVAD